MGIGEWRRADGEYVIMWMGESEWGAIGVMGR
jgi:hypothetical protein